MTGKKVIISIPQFGAPKVEAVGFNGEGCTEATAAFGRALTAAPAESRDYKPEWMHGTSEEAQEQQTW